MQIRDSSRLDSPMQLQMFRRRQKIGQNIANTHIAD
jgi:hypothetical protein